MEFIIRTEPVLGTLINFLNMKRVNTRGIDLATKHILFAALAYNLKKYLKFNNKKYAANFITPPIENLTIIGNNMPILLFFIFFCQIFRLLEKNNLKNPYTKKISF